MSSHGNNNNSGLKKNDPVLTLSKAFDLVKNRIDKKENDFIIHIASGIYNMENTSF